VDVKEEARKTFESLLEDFVEMQNREQDEDLYEELDNRVYSISKKVTYELQLAGGGPAYWILFDDDDGYISNIRFEYAWWSSPMTISSSNMTETEYSIMLWFVEQFTGGDISWLSEQTS